MLRLLLAVALLLRALVAASDPFFAPANNTQLAGNNTSITLALSNRTHWQLVPLTSAALSALPRPSGLSGTIVLANDNITNSFAGQIVCISCDASLGLLTSNDVFQHAIDTNATAVVFYTLSAQVCQPQSQSFASSLPYVYSTSSVADARNITASVSSLVSQMQKPTIFATQDISNYTSHQQTDSGSTTSTAVAMIILYSVTGVITLLFLVIIVSGAIRAHRHPERYGPRNVLGLSRQSRAKGIARAMLETIPIVKFSDSRPAKQIDVELGGHNSKSQTEPAEVASNEDGRRPSATERDIRTEDLADGPGAQNVSVLPEHHDTEALGCSICIENFVEGEDLRVLPCNHRFHPACVDPWLLDVSGTCPLCRVDLRPAGSRSEDGNDDERQDSTNNDQVLPPPLDPDGGSRRYRARMSAFFRRNPITTPDERIAALRRLREERRANIHSGPENVDQSLEDQTRWQRVRQRLRNM